MCVKHFHFKCVDYRQHMSKKSIFGTTYVHKCTVKTIVSYNALHYLGED